MHILCKPLHLYSFRPPPPPPIDTSGIFAPKHLGMEVTLHVFLPVDLWDYEKQKTEVRVCFGHPRMGDWQPVTVLKFAGLEHFCCLTYFMITVNVSIFRVVGDNLYEYFCCLSIDCNIVKFEYCVPYKYYVTNQEKPWEFLHGVKTWGGDIVNRCLQVPRESYWIGGTYTIPAFFQVIHFYLTYMQYYACHGKSRI